MFGDYLLRFILNGVTSENIGVTCHSIDHRAPTCYRSCLKYFTAIKNASFLRWLDFNLYNLSFSVFLPSACYILV